MSSATIRPLFRIASRSLIPATHATRAFSVSAFNMAEGATGGVKPGGAAQGDAFSRRETAAEELFIREQEKEKLLAVKQKIAQQQSNLKDLDKFIDELTTKKNESEK